MKIISHIEDLHHPVISKTGKVWVTDEWQSVAHHIVELNSGEQRHTSLLIGIHFFGDMEKEATCVALDIGYNEKSQYFHDIHDFETKVSTTRAFLVDEQEIPKLTQELQMLLDSDFSHAGLTAFYQRVRHNRPEISAENGKRAPLNRSRDIEARMLEAEAMTLEAA